MARVLPFAAVSIIVGCAASVGGAGQPCLSDGRCDGALWCLAGICESQAEPVCTAFPCSRTVSEIPERIHTALDVLYVLKDSG